MHHQQQHFCPFITEVFRNDYETTDIWPATYHGYKPQSGTGASERRRRAVADPSISVRTFLMADLSLGVLSDMSKHLWFAGSKRPPIQLHLHVAMGRQIVVDERMQHHLVWHNSGKIFLRPLPSFLLYQRVWQSELACPVGCTCTSTSTSSLYPQTENGDPKPSSCMRNCREIALGFLHTYSCIIASETDFLLALEHRLLPRGPDGHEIKWLDWKAVAREILASREQNEVHPRFHHGELRLSRLNAIHRVIFTPPFKPYIRGWNNYGSLLNGNLTWTVTATVFVALVLTALQVGLGTEQLMDNKTFHQFSYGFTIFAIVAPLGVFSLVVLAVLYNLVDDLPWALSHKGKSGQYQQPVDNM